ncbi:MAG: UDP-N-acetylmuramate--L-alanine ligase, partial [Candidatus Bipolaricaulota bacterium]
ATYGSLGRLEDTLAAFVARAPRQILCIDDPRVRRIADSIPTARTAGFSREAHVRCVRAQADADRTRFLLEVGGRRVGWAILPAPGEHNVRNALCAVAASVELGVPPAVAAWALSRVRLPERRFEILERGAITVVDDFAHLPAEVATTVRAAREGWADRRLVCVFQPHRYSRTKALGDRFGAAFRDADSVIVTGIYPACEPARPDVTSQIVVDAIARDAGPVELHYAEDRGQLLRLLESTIVPGDLVLGLGAGDLTSVMHDVAHGVRERAHGRGRC